MGNRQDEAYDEHAGNGQVADDEASGYADGQAPPGGPRHASRRAAPGWLSPSRLFRPRSVRAKIVSVLMVPVISLMALWGFATVTTAQSVSALQQLKEVNATLLEPINAFVSAVQAERTAAGQYLVSPDLGTGGLETAGDRTNAAVAELRDGIARSSTDAAAVDPRLPARIDSLVTAADYVSTIRSRVETGNVSWVAAFDAYSAVVVTAFDVSGVLTQLDAPGVEYDPRVVLELALAREMIARENAVMTSAYEAEVMTQAQYAALVSAAQAGQALLWTDFDDPRPSAEAAYRQILDGESYQALREHEDTLVAAQAGYTIVSLVPPDNWRRAANAVQQQLGGAETRIGTSAAAEAELFGSEVLGSSGLAVILGLIGVVLSLLISVLIGRGLVVELVGLHNSAMDLARRKLPGTLGRLNAGQKVELETEAPRAKYGDDEVSQVADALNVVHRAAVQAAIERSDMVKGISGVYVYLARRSQVLLHRQLALLDSMERRTEDPDQLEDLFRLDHLTTRMRRLAESLIILSGVLPARRWRTPVPMMDVVRAAVAEIEEFTRVEVTRIPDVRIAGTAVADLTHLIAELVENAVVFSPPHTKAQVRGELVGTGLALEIEDRGLGMSRQALADANRRINDTEQIDLLETDQLGLFVVNRLAHRHNVEVTLQRSPYGGITAIVLVPDELLEKPSTPGELPGGTHSLEQQPQLTAVGSVSASRGPADRRPDASSQPPAEWRQDGPAEWQDGSAEWQDGPAEWRQDGPAEWRQDGPAEWRQDGPADWRSDRPAQWRQDWRHDPRQDPQQDMAVHGSGAGADDAMDSQADGLPRRVRQASLRPELRESRPSTRSASSRGYAARTPENARATLAALRSGWLRGQSDRNEDSSQGRQS